MAAIKLNKDTITQVVKSATDFKDSINQNFGKGFKQTLEDCGISADNAIGKGILETADSIVELLKKVSIGVDNTQVTLENIVKDWEGFDETTTFSKIAGDIDSVQNRAPEVVEQKLNEYNY